MSRTMPRQVGAKVFIAAMAMVALACFWIGFAHWHSTDPIKFLCYVVVAFLASFLKIKLPGINGTMSVNFLFILLGVLEMSFAETLVIGFATFLVQSYWDSRRCAISAAAFLLRSCGACQSSARAEIFKDSYLLEQRSTHGARRALHERDARAYTKPTSGLSAEFRDALGAANQVVD